MAVPALFATVRARPDPFRPVKTASSGAGPAGGGFDGTERAGTRSDGREQGRDSADGCGEDRTSVQLPAGVVVAASGLIRRSLLPAIDTPPR